MYKLKLTLRKAGVIVVAILSAILDTLLVLCAIVLAGVFAAIALPVMIWIGTCVLASAKLKVVR